MVETRRFSSSAFALLICACAGRVSAPRPAAAPAARSATAYQEPIAARLLLPVHQTLRFELSEPAYVTIFEIVPGRGVSIVYPTPNDDAADRKLPAGSSSVFAVAVDVGRFFYVDPLPVSRSAGTYLYMIASREPLRIGDVLKRPATLRRAVGFANFSAENEQRVMDAVDATFVPDYVADDAWTSDWIALWPDPTLASQRADANVLVPQCEMGLVVVPVPDAGGLANVCVTPDAAQALTRASNQPQRPAPRHPTDSTSDSTAKPEPAARGSEVKSPSDNAHEHRSPDGHRRAGPTRRAPLTLAVDYGAPGESGVVRRGGSGAPLSSFGSRSSGRPWAGVTRDGRTPTLDGPGGERTYRDRLSGDRSSLRLGAGRRESGEVTTPTPAARPASDRPLYHGADAPASAPRTLPAAETPRRDPARASSNDRPQSEHPKTAERR